MRRTLTEGDCRSLLALARRRSARDELLFALSLTAGLRVGELCALDVGDVWDAERQTVRWRVTLPASKRRRPFGSEVLLTESTTRRVRRYLSGSNRSEGPLFTSNRGPGGLAHRLGDRGMRTLWERYQRELRWVDRRGRPLYRFHDLRATGITLCLRRTGNLELARRFARHDDARTTKTYLNLSADEVRDAAPDL